MCKNCFHTPSGKCYKHDPANEDIRKFSEAMKPMVDLLMEDYHCETDAQRERLRAMGLNV